MNQKKKLAKQRIRDFDSFSFIPLSFSSHIAFKALEKITRDSLLQQ